MSGLTELAVPCRLVALKVLLGPESGLTTLEDLVARAIAAGRTTVEQQVELFRLPERIIVDVVHSLWSKGHILVRFDTGGLDLTDGARTQLTHGGIGEAAAVQETRRFLFEPVTGQLFPEERGHRRAPEEALELPAHQGVTTADLSAGDLLEAVQAAIRHERRKTGFRRNVLDVGFGSPMLRPPEELRWVTVRVNARIDSARDTLTVSLVDDEHMWNMRARQRMAQHLGNLAEEQPDHDFVRRLTGRADRGLVKPDTLESVLAQMAHLVNGLPERHAPLRAQAQRQLDDLAVRIAERINDADRGKASAMLVESAAGYVWAVEELIRSATAQLVISSPGIRYSALNALLPALNDRLAKGVNLVLLWGRTAADALPIPVATAFNELKTRYRNQVLFDVRSAQTDACLVIQDGSRAFFGSHSPLSVEAGRNLGEIGVLIEPSAEGPTIPRCVADALFWARQTYPFAVDAARIELEPETRDEPPRLGALELPTRLPTPELPAPDEAAARLWAESWAEYYASVLASLEQSADKTPSVELIRDSEHRDLIDVALGTRSHRLAITDDRFDPRVGDDTMARRIREVAAGGAVVHLVHPRPKVAGNVGKAFAELLVAQEAGIHVRQRQAGVRAVLSDDSVLLGSFSPLSEGARGGARARIGQLGVHIRGVGFADAFADSLGILSPGPSAKEDQGAQTRSQIGSEESLQRSRTAASAALPLLEQARRAQGPEGFTGVLSERMAELDDPWLVLDRWEKAGVPASELRRGAAVVLELGSANQTEPRGQWIKWLVADAWQRRAFVEAAVVGRLLPRPEDAAACAAAAALEVGPLQDLLVDSALILAECESSAGVVGAVAGMAETLLWGGADGAQVAGMFQDAVPEHWQHLVEIVRNHEAGAPLPMKAFSSATSLATDKAAAESAWVELAGEIDHMEQLRGRFDFDAGIAMHDGLFASDGLLTAVRSAARSPRLRPGLTASLPGNVRRHLDELVHAAGRQVFAWRAQMSFLRKIETIVRTARELALTEADQPTDAANFPQYSYCRRLGSLLTASWDDLFSEMSQVSAPQGLTMIALLDRLQPLYDWAREQQ